jgi:hypothetical protein
MDPHRIVELLTELAEKLGIECRVAPLGGSGGALCTIKGRQVLFVDAEADVSQQADALGSAFAAMDLENVFLVPQLRQFLEDCRRRAV